MLFSLDRLDDLHTAAKMGAMCGDNPSFLYAKLEPIFHVSVAESAWRSIQCFYATVLQILRIAWSLLRDNYNCWELCFSMNCS